MFVLLVLFRVTLHMKPLTMTVPGVSGFFCEILAFNRPFSFFNKVLDLNSSSSSSEQERFLERSLNDFETSLFVDF